MTSLEQYILRKYVKSKFIKEFHNKEDNIASMFVKIGDKFGFGMSNQSPQTMQTHFYDLKTSNGLLKVCFLDYDLKSYSGIYMTKDKNLFAYSYKDKTFTDINVTDLSEQALEKYNAYIDEKQDEKELFLLDINDDKRYYYDRDAKIYDSDFKEIDSNDTKYTAFVDLLSEIVQSVNV